MTSINDSKTDEKQVEDSGPTAVKVKVDSTGLPLLPQPSTSPFDPLNYPNTDFDINVAVTLIQWLRYTILLEICMLAFLGTLNVAIINPAVVPLSTELGITNVMGTYQTTIAIGAGALGPVFFTPFANVYGRRPVYLLSILIGFASAIGSAKAKSFGTLMFTRVMNGFGPSAAFGLGAGTVVDLFFAHERGKAMGVMFIICFFFMPETLFDRAEKEVETTPSDLEVDEGEIPPSIIGEPFKPPPMSLATYLNRLRLLERRPSRQLKKNEFIIKPFSMLKFPSVIFPALFLLANGVSLLVGA
ncbi:hypothetical protein C0993_010137 [Termitomyces sp. T159_Od127]|nr:hypothetical protein C0993_010137 [Termitomyces sp. T159_Od127]